MKKCQYCSCENQNEALVCRNCLRPFPTELVLDGSGKSRKAELLKCPSCGYKNDSITITCSKCGYQLINPIIRSKKPSKRMKTRFLFFDLFSLLLLGGIAYLYSQPIYPNQTVQLTLWDRQIDLYLYMYSELISSIALIAGFFVSALSMIFLRNRPKLSGFLWLIVAIGISAHPIVVLVEMAKQSSYTYSLFHRGFTNLLLLVFPIFLLAMIRVFYTSNNELN